jgi:ubiquinone/menaquinone biosynthesis C-methylase UbiE
MEGYGPTTYGDRIAEVYDAFYEETLDTDRAAEALAELAGSGPVLELAIGTGRLARPLAERASRCTGSTPRSGWSRGSGRSPAATRSRL